MSRQLWANADGLDTDGTGRPPRKKKPRKAFGVKITVEYHDWRGRLRKSVYTTWHHTEKAQDDAISAHGGVSGIYRGYIKGAKVTKEKLMR